MTASGTNADPSERGILVIISSPSGAGKTTLSRRLLGEFPKRLSFSVSYTTRAPRANEQNGVDYFFVDNTTFEQMVADNAFAEWAEVHGNRYGTSQQSVERALVSGNDVVFDVDYQGGRVLSDKWPDDSLKIFILPPDLGTLESRLKRRATDAEDVIQRRLRKAIEELEYHRDYQHLIVNDDLDQAYATLRAVYLVRRHCCKDGKDSKDAPSQFAAEVALVQANQSSGSDEHARKLIAAGRTG